MNLSTRIYSTIIVLFVSNFIYCQDNEWLRLNEEVLRLYDEGKYQEALSTAEMALIHAEINYGTIHENTSKSLNNLGSLYLQTGNIEKAERCLKESVAIDEKLYGSNHSNLTTPLNAIYEFYYYKDDQENAAI
jgi:tetratricopeptide (TPR) repeat protein